MGVYTERYGKVTRQSVPLFTRCWPVERDSSEPCAVITVIFVQAFGLISENDPLYSCGRTWFFRCVQKKEQRQREKACAVKRSRVVSFVCLCPLLLSHGILSLCALISGAVTGARSSELHLHFKHWGKWPAAARTGWHTGLYACEYTHTLTPSHTDAVRARTHLHTEIYTSSWDVLTFPLGLPEMSSPPAAANSPFQPLTLPGAGAVRWSTNDLCAFRLSRLIQSVHPSHISHCLCNYIPLIYCTASPSDCVSVYSPPRRYPHLFSIPVRKLVPNCVRLQPSTSL